MSKKIWIQLLLMFCAFWGLGNQIAFSDTKPAWVDGASLQYPQNTHLTAVGFGDDRQSAESSAYGAIARIFRSEIHSVTQEAERFSQTEGSREETRVDRSVDIQSQTAVRSKIALEQVQIVEHWVDPLSKVHYALAAMNRSQAAMSLRQKMLEAASEAKTWEVRAKEASEPLVSAKALQKALKASKRVDEYQSHLRVIDSGKTNLDGGLSLTPDLKGQLNTLLNEHFQVELVLSGPHAKDVEAAILEGLNQQGFTLGPNSSLLVTGVIRFEKTGPKSPVWHFVRWSTRITLTEKASGQVFGTIRRTGREGQLSPDAADEKALIALQDELSETVGHSVYQFIFGE